MKNTDQKGQIYIIALFYDSERKPCYLTNKIHKKLMSHKYLAIQSIETQIIAQRVL